VGGRDIFLDPGTKFCPFGLLYWTRTSALGLKLDKKGGSFITVPGAAYDKATTRRVADMSLDGEGSLKGTITVKFEGGEALQNRLDQLETDEAGKKKLLEDELQEWLPASAIVKVAKVEGWETPEDPLIATFDVEMPGYASAAGKRLLLPAYLFQARQMGAFKLSSRKFPVYFPYAFAEVDKVNITIPAGYFLESVPKQQDARLDYASYQNLAQFDGKKLVTQRVLQVNGIFFAVDSYPLVKDFFSKVQAGDEEQAVLTGGSTNAQKGN
jgi:hypothetical protein